MAEIHTDEPAPTNGDRPLWEVLFCLKFNDAAGVFLRAYNATGDEANLLRQAYETRDLKQWAKDRIEMLLAECETERAGRLLSTSARDAVQDSAAALLQAELFGNAQSAGILRIEV